MINTLFSWKAANDLPDWNVRSDSLICVHCTKEFPTQGGFYGPSCDYCDGRACSTSCDNEHFIVEAERMGPGHGLLARVPISFDSQPGAKGVPSEPWVDTYLRSALSLLVGWEAAEDVLRRVRDATNFSVDIR